MKYYLPIELSKQNVTLIPPTALSAREQSGNPEHVLTEVETMHRTYRGDGVKVGIVDTGLSQHYDLPLGRVYQLTGVGYQGSDRHGHGTHVAGIAGAGHTTAKMVGCAPECYVVMTKGLTDDGWGDDAVIADCIAALVSERCDVISLSIGGDGRSDRIAKAVEDAQINGAIVVAASGNGGNAYPRDSYPGGLDDVLTIGACDQQGRVASFSQPSHSMDMVANGVQYLSTYLNSMYARMSGTSMSTPHVSGAVACLIECAKKTGRMSRTKDLVEIVLESIRETSSDVYIPGRDNLTGIGIPNFAKATMYILESSLPPTPPPADPKDPAEEIVIEIDKTKHKNIRNINIKFV